MAIRSHVARKMPRHMHESAWPQRPQRPQSSNDPLAREVTRAFEETLDELRKSKVAKDRASLAQALRNLRETYHLVTGEARPGQIKSVAPQRPTRPAAGRVVELMPPPAPPENPACGVEPTARGVPAETPVPEIPQGNNPL